MYQEIAFARRIAISTEDAVLITHNVDVFASLQNSDLFHPSGLCLILKERIFHILTSVLIRKLTALESAGIDLTTYNL